MKVGWWLGLASLWLAGAGCFEDAPCAGTPLPCAERGRFSCIEGCVSTPVCVVACEGVSHEADCSLMPACTWSYATTSCIAGSDPCSASTSEEACVSDGSCLWSSICTGSPKPCDYDDEDSCSAVPGCMLLKGL